MAGRGNTKRRKPKRRREDLTEEEIRRLKAKRKKKRQLVRRRRFYFILLILFLILIIFSFGRIKKSGSSVSENSVSGNESALPSAGGTDGTEGIGGRTRSDDEDIEEEVLTQSDMLYEYTDGLINMSVPFDVYSGRCAYSSESVSGNNLSKLKACKEAMSTQAYFTGSDKNINATLMEYGEGKWHGIYGTDGDILVFYEGERVPTEVTQDVSGNTVIISKNPVTFEIKFSVYDDGQFILTGATEDGKNIEDYGLFVKEILGK